MGRHPKSPPRIHDYDIRLKADATPILFTWYRGHAFDGWISQAKLEQAERDGVLSWDGEGNPVIRHPSAAVAKAERKSAPAPPQE